ncbi:InlB B-repeat-containing protein [Acetobacterium bakii]|uniref:DUF8194 domain-containing protein n=1 Tax=Acetobacterium bakii TaxID=52689 RepID=A0A0L6U1N5_9FIRM|nr:InlB B-repeat-containing protein [Acetobacterium bakii]KNZ42416.1 hypothetical protein AKG39_06525 [Acetobacterium bakii]
MDSIVRKRFKSWWLCLLVVVMTGFLWGSFPSVAHGEDNSATVPGNASYTEDAFYYSDQYMWKVSLFVAKSDTVNKDSSTMDDFYRIGTQAVYLNPVKNMSQWYAGARPSNISGLYFSKENKVDTLNELRSKGGDVNALDSVQITTGNNVNMITGVSNLPFVPQLSDGDVYDNGVTYGDAVGSITKVANYFNSSSMMFTLLNFYANKQGVSKEEMIQNLQFTIDGETRTGWNPEGVLPNVINDNPTNQVEWLVVYEPVSIIYVKDTTHPGSYYGYALTATDFAVSQIKHQMDWRYDETRWSAWAGQQPDAWKANSDRQHVSRLAFLLMGNSVITSTNWYGLEAGTGVDQNAAIPFNRWFSDRQTKYGGWGMSRWIKPAEYEKPRDNDYRPNTDVILSTPVYANVNATPGNELTVTYKINGEVIGTDKVVAPIKTESYSYLKWHTPTVDTVTTYDLEMSVSPYPEGTINCGGNEYTHRIVTIRPLDENTPPDPKVDDEKPVDLPDILVPPTSVESGDTVDPTVAPVVKSVQEMTEPPYYKNETVKIQVVTNMATKNLSFTNSDTGAGKQFGVDSLGDEMLINRTVNKLSNEIVWTIEFIPLNLGTNNYQFKALNSEQGESQALDFSVEVLVDPDMPEIFDITINPLKAIYTLYEETVSPPLKYMLIYNTNGGSDMDSVMADYNKTISAPGNPVKVGQSFKGWFKNNTLTELWNFSMDKITGVTTLYAKWEISTYSVSFDLNGKGSPIAALVLTYGENIEKPADPEAIGCVFDGWYQDDALTDSWDFNNDTVSDNTTLHAKWKILEYVATFEENKGSLVDDVKQDFGTKLVEPTTNRLGYTLDGWYRENSLTTKWNFATDTLQDSITLYAKWIAGDAFIEFNANEGSAVQKMSGKTDLAIDTTTLPVSTRLGYTFDGWFEKEDLSGDALTKLPDQYPPGTTIYYAKWTANPSTIKFESNGGSAVTALVGVTDQVITDKTMPISTRTGYTLEGWYASVDLSGAKVANLPDKYPVDGIIYYAKWNGKPSTIKFESNSGSAVTDLVGVTDQVITDKTMPLSIRAGYTLDGWCASVDLSGAMVESLPDKYPVDGITYYAKWTANPSTIKFESNSGSAVTDLIGVTDQAIKDKTMPTSTRAGYALEGWYASSDLSGSKVAQLPDKYPVDGTTYYAKWVKISSTSIDLPESSNAIQTHELTLNNSYDFHSIASDQGNITVINVGDNQIKVELSGGTSHRTGLISGSYNTTSKGKTETRTSQGSNTTPSSIYYNSNGYTGTLYKQTTTTNDVQTGGSYVPDDNKTKTETRTSQGSNTTPSSIYYNSNGYTGTLYKQTTTTNNVQTGGSYVSDDTKYVTHHHEQPIEGYPYPAAKIGYNSGGYMGTISMTSISSRKGNYYVEYGGMATKPGYDTRTYRTDYTATYSGTITKPGYDTRTYRTDYTSTYSGTITKFISDTRVYGPYYKYTVTINYIEK